MSVRTSHESSYATATLTRSARADALAARLEAGANALITLAHSLSDAEWRRTIPGDGRKIGVVVHHVGSMYQLEMQFAAQLAGGSAIVGVTMMDINAVNARHAADFDSVGKEEAISFVRTNSCDAANAIRDLSDRELDTAAPISLYGDAPLTCQFFLEDHPVRHSYHHVARIRAALNR
jgi:hypothetical protein